MKYEELTGVEQLQYRMLTERIIGKRPIVYVDLEGGPYISDVMSVSQQVIFYYQAVGAMGELTGLYEGELKQFGFLRTTPRVWLLAKAHVLERRNAAALNDQAYGRVWRQGQTTAVIRYENGRESTIERYEPNHLGLNSAAFVNHWPVAAANHAANHPGAEISDDALMASPACTPYSVASGSHWKNAADRMRDGLVRPLNECNASKRMSILQQRLAEIQARNNGDAHEQRMAFSQPCTVERATPVKTTTEHVDDFHDACASIMGMLMKFSKEMLAEAYQQRLFSMHLAEAMLEDALTTLRENKPQANGQGKSGSVADASNWNQPR